MKSEGGRSRPCYLLPKAWLGEDSLWESASKLLHRFPKIIKLAERAHPGDRFLVPVSGAIKKM